MKNKLLLSFVILLSLALLTSIGTWASDAEGWEFAEGEMYDIVEFLKSAPSTFEATIYIEDTENSAGVMFGNFYRADNGTPALNLSIEAGGIPTLTLHSAANTDTVISFDRAVIEAGKKTSLKIVLDRTEGKALCYMDGTLTQTVEADSIPVIEGTMYQFVLGGDRSIGSEYQSNPNYFKGILFQFACYGENEEAPLLSYDFASNENTDSLIKDLSGNGYDAVFSKQYITSEELPERIDDYAYSFAVLGDPQYVAHYKTNAYVPMYEWIVEQDPEYVISLGDITDWNGVTEWAAAKKAIGLLDEAGIPHTHIKGNHDEASYFNENLPWSKYGHIYDGITAGAYEENMLNTWRIIEIGDTKWMIVGLEYEPADDVLLWASDAIKAHPEHNVIIATHDYLNRQGYTYKTQYDTWSKTTERLWTGLADKHSNVVLTLCGHISSDNVIVRTRENSAGRNVTEMLIDFQNVDLYYDTLAMVTMFHFSRDGKTLQIENYSTDNKAYFKNINQFTVTLDTLEVAVSEVENNGTPDYDLSSANKTGSIDGYTWSLCGDTLVISGKADGRVLTDTSAIAEFTSDVKRIVIENSTEITELGAGLFSGFEACREVIIPARLNRIGSKVFENMKALTTVALYNDYYGADFAESGIIDLRDINYLSTDSFEGAASEAVIIYMPTNAIISGEAQKLVSSSSATYYVYPTSAAATLVRSTLDETVTLRYYTVAMTGDERLATEGTNLNDKSEAMFTWTFDAATGKLTLTFKRTDAGFRSTQGFADWKNFWKDAVISIEVADYSNWGKLQIYNDQSTGIYDGYTNLESILFLKSGYYSTMSEIQFGSGNDFGLFSDNPKLSSIGFGSLKEGVIDLSKIATISGKSTTFNNMFRGCESIKEVILPSVATATNLCSGMFSGCSSLISVTLPAALTTIGADSFKGCSSLEFITIPEGVTSIAQTAFDPNITIGTSSLEVYNTVKGYGYNAAIDMRAISLESVTIERDDASPALTVFLDIGSDIGEYTADGLYEKFGDNVTYYVYPTSSGATAVRKLIENNCSVSMIYYPESIYPELKRSGENIESGNLQFIYSFDESNGLLTVTTKTAYGMLRGPEYAGNTFIPWKLLWKDAITAIEIVKGSGGSKIQYQKECATGIFDNYPNLVSIKLNGNYSEIQNGAHATFGIFENNPKLTTIITSGTADSEGVYLNGFKKATTATTMNKAFRGCTSITKVVFRNSAPENGSVINADMFAGCVNLTEIKIPSYITEIKANAFANCTSLEYAILTSTATTADPTSFDGTDARLICFDDAQVEAINTSLASGSTEAEADLFGALEALGVSIRMTGYNGLRYIYSFDNKENSAMKNAGYTLLEYGLIVSSAENIASAVISGSKGDYSVSSGAIKLSVYNASEGIVGKILSSSTENHTDFAGTVIKFDETNAKSDVYVGTYSVYSDASGKEYISYADYGEVNEEYKTASLFKVTFDMYASSESGIRNESIDAAAVWSTLLLGAVDNCRLLPLDGADGVTLTVVSNGEGKLLAFLKSSSEISENAKLLAFEKLNELGYSDAEIIDIVIP